MVEDLPSTHEVPRLVSSISLKAGCVWAYTYDTWELLGILVYLTVEALELEARATLPGFVYAFGNLESTSCPSMASGFTHHAMSPGQFCFGSCDILVTL